MIMKNLLITLALLLAVATSLQIHQDQVSSDELTEDIITGSLWKLYNDDGRLGIVEFEDDGKFTLYDNDFLNTAWATKSTWLFDNEVLLIKRAADGVADTKFVHAIKDNYGKWHLEGRYFLANNEGKGWRHYLIQE